MTPAPFSSTEIVAEYLGYAQRLKPFVRDTTAYLLNAVESGRRILLEGAQGALLDVDHGTYPFVTSSNSSGVGVSSGSGIPGRWIKKVIGVVKAYSTRVGGGPFPTEQDNEIGQHIRDRGNEYGTVTRRPRRCGWIDLVALRYACMLNGVTNLVMTKADVLDDFEKLEVCCKYQIDGKETAEVPFQMLQHSIKPILSSFNGWKSDITAIRSYGELPEPMRAYISFIDKYLKVKVSYISNGPGRNQLIENI